MQRVRSIPGVARADNLIVWYAIVALPTGAKESVIYYGLEDFPAWRFPWNVESGDPADLRRGRYVMLDASAERRFGPFRVGRLSRVSGTPAQDHRPDPRSPSFTTSPVAFLDYGLAQSLSPDELRGRTTFIVVRLEPGADARPSGARSAAACPTTTSTPRPSGRRGRAATGSRAPGWG